VRRTADKALQAGTADTALLCAHAEVDRRLERAESYLEMKATVRTGWLGTRMQGAWAYIRSAELASMDLMDEAQLDAYSSHVVALSGKYLKDGAPERIAIKCWSERLRSGDGSTPVRAWYPGPTDRLALAQALQAAHERIADEYHRLRRFQLALVITSAMILVLVGVLVVVGMVRPAMVPLCFPDPGSPDADGTSICPSGQAGTPEKYDVALVVLFGLLGAALTGVRSVAQSSVASSVPMSTTRFFQALFKAALGTLVAVLGLLFLRAGVVPGFTKVDTQSQILTYAVFFGAAQELLTRLIDQRSNTLLAGATSTEHGQQPTTAPRRR
jgi:hypothetical protein